MSSSTRIPFLRLTPPSQCFSTKRRDSKREPKRLLLLITLLPPPFLLPQLRSHNHSTSHNSNKRQNNRGRGRGRHNQQCPWYNNNWQNNWNPSWSIPYYQGPIPQWSGFPTPWTQQGNRGILGSAPQRPPQTQALIADAQFQPTTDFAQAFNTMTIADPGAANWYMDSGATAHLASSSGTLKSILKNCTGISVKVGNGSHIPITSSGSTSLASYSRPLSLNNVLVAPNIIKNFISVRRFTNDNWCSVEFDPFGFSIKDLSTKKILLRSDSSGELYSVPSHINKPTTTPQALVVAAPSLWHKRLGHVNNGSLRSLMSSNSISCNKGQLPLVCEACQLGKHLKLPFSDSNKTVSAPFALVHSDIWNSPVSSLTGIKYYVLFLDHFSHILWVYPLRKKSEVFSKFADFCAFVKTQFKTSIQSFQCDNDGEYNNTKFLNFFSSSGIVVRFSCPHTSQQNGRSERMIRTINNTIRTLLFQARLPTSYWVEALHTAVHLLNILPSTSIQNRVPYTILYQKKPSYTHLRTFGCLCFPNLNHSFLHKLAARSTPCLFLGYPSSHKGYRCVDLKTRKIIISRHVVFDESIFPLAKTHSTSLPKSYDFLDETSELSPTFKNILVSPMQPSPVPAQSASSSTILPTATTLSAPPQRHPMTTRSRDSTLRQRTPINLHTSTISPLPTSHLKALNDPNWNPSMTDEYGALVKW